MNSKYFLGANSSAGFFSLYENFCRRGSDYLCIIKGGAGTGKSGFMRRIGAEAEKRGYDVEYVLCSGDPASLDGVYIPALHRGWMDGTAPHAAEPPRFGVDGEYIDLSRFCAVPLEKQDASAARELYAAYKARYRAAYAFLNALASVKKTYETAVPDESDKRAIEKRAEAVFPKRRRGGSDGTAEYRFLHCVCGDGEIRLAEELEKESKAYVLTGGAAFTDYALKHISHEAARRGFDVISCLSPHEPERFEAVIIPEADTAVCDEGYALSAAKRIELDDLNSRKQAAESLFNCGQIENQLGAAALASLGRAKKLHDELEEIYKKAMDFAALTAFTDAYVAETFK